MDNIGKYEAIQEKTLGKATADISAFRVLTYEGGYATTDGDPCVGVTNRDFLKDEFYGVITEGQAFVLADGSVTKNDLLYASSSVDGAAKSIGSPTTEVPFARALEDGSDTDIIKVEVLKHGLVS